MSGNEARRTRHPVFKEIAMSDTIVLRKKAHWFIVGAPNERDARSALVLSLLEYAEKRSFDVALDDVESLARDLGWTLDQRRGFIGAA